MTSGRKGRRCRVELANQWPAALPEFKPILLGFQERATALAIRVLRAFAAALEQPEDVFAPIYTPASNPLIKIIRYPGRAAGTRHDATVPLLSLPPHLATQARGITQDPDNPLFREVGRNYLKSRLRSHPDVARRHYADLLDPASAALEPASVY